MKNLILLSLICFFSGQAHATGVFSMGSQSGGATRTYATLPFYFDVGVSQNQAKLKGGGLTAEQSLLTLQMGATFAIGGPIFAGLSYDYRTISQFSETNLIDGNQSGKREGIYPTVGVRFYNFVFKIDYETSGDYKLDRKNASGNDVAYTSPKGIRGTFLIDLYRGMSVGASYESVTFASTYEGGTANIGLSDNVTMTQMGLALAYVY